VVAQDAWRRQRALSALERSVSLRMATRHAGPGSCLACAVAAGDGSVETKFEN
jgi:hypothetical protein